MQHVFQYWDQCPWTQWSSDLKFAIERAEAVPLPSLLMSFSRRGVRLPAELPSYIKFSATQISRTMCIGKEKSTENEEGIQMWARRELQVCSIQPTKPYFLCADAGLEDRVSKFTESWRTIQQPYDRIDYTSRWDWWAWQLLIALLPSAGELGACNNQ